MLISKLLATYRGDIVPQNWLAPRQSLFKSHPPPSDLRHPTSLAADPAPAAAFVTIPCAQIRLLDYSGRWFKETSG